MIFVLGSFFVGRAAISANTLFSTELAIETLTDGQKQVYLHIEKNQACYWIKYTDNSTNYLIQMNVYDNPEHNCMGVVKERKYIVVDHPVNIQGNICVCYDEDYSLEFSDIGKTSLLQISKFEPDSPFKVIPIGTAGVVKVLTGQT